MKVHLVDGTYELFRQNFGRAAREPDAGPYAATAGVLMSTLQLLADGATHIAVASDHIIESFRNDLWPGYKTSAGMPPELLEQIPMVEEALVAMGVTTWAMVSHEADDALAAAAAVADADERVEQVLIITPDKDLGQCVRGKRVVQFDRRKREIIDEDGVIAKFGVPPASIPDYLGLVGDSSDGFPGIAGWGAKSAAAVLARYGHLEEIPDSAGQWDVPGLRGAAKLSVALQGEFALALLFRRIATVDTDLDVGAVDDWAWTGPTPEFDDWAVAVGEPATGRARRHPGRPPLTRSFRSGNDDDPCASRRRPGDLRHTGGAAEGCYLPVLTWFTGTRCTGPDRRLVTHGSRWGQGSRALACCHPRRGARAAESARLESVCGATHRGFESHSLRS